LGNRELTLKLRWRRRWPSRQFSRSLCDLPRSRKPILVALWKVIGQVVLPGYALQWSAELIPLDDARAIHSRSPPQAGNFVEVRGRRWLVEEVEAGQPSIASLSPARRGGFPCPPQFSFDVVTHLHPSSLKSAQNRNYHGRLPANSLPLLPSSCPSEARLRRVEAHLDLTIGRASTPWHVSMGRS
jgi:hypothetical protein